MITGLLLGLSLPPSAPFWLPLVGGGAAIFLGKKCLEVWGKIYLTRFGRKSSFVGFLAEGYVYLVGERSFGFSGFSGGGAASTFSGVEMVTTPTPLSIAQMYGYSSLHQADPRILWRLFVGQVPGFYWRDFCASSPHRIFISVVARVVHWDIPFLILLVSLVWLFWEGKALFFIS